MSGVTTAKTSSPTKKVKSKIAGNMKSINKSQMRAKTQASVLAKQESQLNAYELLEKDSFFYKNEILDKSSPSRKALTKKQLTFKIAQT